MASGLIVPGGNFFWAFRRLPRGYTEFLVTAHSDLQFNLCIRNESGPLPLGTNTGTDGGTMLMRGIGAVALTLSLSSEALAEKGVMQREYLARWFAFTWQSIQLRQQKCGRVVTVQPMRKSRLRADA
jgi:hypothetical protein